MKQTQNTSSPLLTAPIALMIRKIGTPVAIGAFFNTMFNVVDTIYGGLISDQALAALSLAFPITFVIIALGFGFLARPLNAVEVTPSPFTNPLGLKCQWHELALNGCERC